MARDIEYDEPAGPDDMVAADIGVTLPRPFALVAYRDDDAEHPEKMVDGMELADGSAYVYGIQPNGRAFSGHFISVDSAADRLDGLPVYR